MDTELHIHERLEESADLCSIISKGSFVQRGVRKVNTLDLGVLNAIHLRAVATLCCKGHKQS